MLGVGLALCSIGCAREVVTTTEVRDTVPVQDYTHAGFVRGTTATEWHAINIYGGSAQHFYQESVSGAATWVSRPVGPGGITLTTIEGLQRSGMYHWVAVDAQNQDVYYGNGVSNRVEWTNAFPGFDVVGKADLAIDGLGRPVIGFVNETSNTIELLVRSLEGIWQRTQVAVAAAKDIALRADSQNRVYVVWSARGAGVSIAIRAEGMWTQRQLWSGNANNVALEIEPASGGDLFSIRPRVAWEDDDNRNLWFAESTSGAWTTELVDDSGTAGGTPALAVDTRGRTWIAHFDRDLLRLKGSVKGADDSSWFTRILDDRDATGFWPDVRIVDGEPLVLEFARIVDEDNESSEIRLLRWEVF